MVLSESGLLNYWAKMVAARSRNKCSDRRIDKPKNSRISLQSLTGAIIILGVGLCVSLFTFFLELLWHHRQKWIQFRKQIYVLHYLEKLNNYYLENTKTISRQTLTRIEIHNNQLRKYQITSMHCHRARHNSEHVFG